MTHNEITLYIRARLINANLFVWVSFSSKIDKTCILDDPTAFVVPSEVSYGVSIIDNGFPPKNA